MHLRFLGELAVSTFGLVMGRAFFGAHHAVPAGGKTKNCCAGSPATARWEMRRAGLTKKRGTLV